MAARCERHESRRTFQRPRRTIGARGRNGFQGKELERPLWLAAWSGNTVYGVGRLSREGKTGVLCWSLFGGFQPDTVRKFLESCMDVVDGLFPRFQVFVWPDPLDAAGRKGADRPADEEAIRSN